MEKSLWSHAHKKLSEIVAPSGLCRLALQNVCYIVCNFIINSFL